MGFLGTAHFILSLIRNLIFGLAVGFLGTAHFILSLIRNLIFCLAVGFLGTAHFILSLIKNLIFGLAVGFLGTAHFILSLIKNLLFGLMSTWRLCDSNTHDTLTQCCINAGRLSESMTRDCCAKVTVTTCHTYNIAIKLTFTLIAPGSTLVVIIWRL